MPSHRWISPLDVSENRGYDSNLLVFQEFQLQCGGLATKLDFFASLCQRACGFSFLVGQHGNTILFFHLEVDVGSLCDNIEVDRESGDLWLGCHPNGYKLFFSDPNDPAGSEVIKIENILSEKPRVTQVYSDDGSVIIGSSVAAPYRGKLLIGTVYQKALICDLK